MRAGYVRLKFGCMVISVGVFMLFVRRWGLIFVWLRGWKLVLEKDLVLEVEKIFFSWLCVVRLGLVVDWF